MRRRWVSGSTGAIAALLGVFCLACSGGSFSARVDNGKGTVNVFLTDAPLNLSGVSKVNVTLTGVILYPEEETAMNGASGGSGGATPVVIMSYPATFDLLTLTGGARALLGTDEVPVGSYSRIRLEVSDASLTYLDGSTAGLKIESGKVDVPIHFKVSQDATTGVVLDFDAAASVQVNDTANGQLILRPVVTPRSVQ